MNYILKFSFFSFLLSLSFFSCNTAVDQTISKSGKVIETDFQKKIKENPIVLIDFSATWCVPCRRQAMILESLEKNITGKAMVIKVDVDENREMANKMNVSVLPTLVLYKNGSQVWKTEGLTSESTIKTAIENN
jgi:thioredoxin 1